MEVFLKHYWAVPTGARRFGALFQNKERLKKEAEWRAMQDRLVKLVQSFRPVA
jgi:hypothetical protein